MNQLTILTSSILTPIVYSCSFRLAQMVHSSSVFNDQVSNIHEQMSGLRDPEMTYFAHEVESLTALSKSIQELEMEVIRLRKEKTEKSLYIAGILNFLTITEHADIKSSMTKEHHMSLNSDRPIETETQVFEWKWAQNETIIALSPSEYTNTVFLMTDDFVLKYVGITPDCYTIYYEKIVSNIQELLFLRSATIKNKEVAIILFLDSKTLQLQLLIASLNEMFILPLQIKMSLDKPDMPALRYHRGISSQRTFVGKRTKNPFHSSYDEQEPATMSGYLVYCLENIWFVPSSPVEEIIVLNVPVDVGGLQGENLGVTANNKLQNCINAFLMSSNPALVCISIDNDIKSILNASLVLNEDGNPTITAKHQMCFKLYPHLLCYTRLTDKKSDGVVKLYLTSTICYIFENDKPVFDSKNELLVAEKDHQFKTVLYDEDTMIISLVSEQNNNRPGLTRKSKIFLLQFIQLQLSNREVCGQTDSDTAKIKNILRVQLDTYASADLCSGFLRFNNSSHDTRLLTTSHFHALQHA